MKPLYLCLLLLFSGCSPERAIQRATSTEEQAEQTQDALKEKYPDLVAEKFEAWFPVKKAETIIRDTVLVPTYLKAEAVPNPATIPKTSTPAPAKAYKPAVACPDRAYYTNIIAEYTNTISELRQKMQKSVAALEAAKEKYRTVQHALFQEQAAHQSTKAAAEKAKKLKTGWKWFNLFLGLLIVWFVLGKIFRLL